MAEQKGVDVTEIWRKYQQGVKIVRIASDLGISRNTVAYHLKRIRSQKNGGGSQTPAHPAPQSTSENFRGRDVNANYDTASPLDEVRTSASKEDDHRATA